MWFASYNLFAFHIPSRFTCITITSDFSTKQLTISYNVNTIMSEICVSCGKFLLKYNYKGFKS